MKTTILPLAASALLSLSLPLGALNLSAPLAGCRDGLYSIEPDGKTVALWGDGEARKILRTSRGWYVLSDAGIVFSSDLRTFSHRDGGIPTKTIKVIGADGAKSFMSQAEDLKDLEADPDNDAVMVSCSKDRVYLSSDAGASWAEYGSPVSTTGLAAVAVYSNPVLTIIASHPIKGLFRLCPSGGSRSWAPMNEGLPLIPGTTSVDEISDVKAVKETGGIGLYASGSFLPRIYKWNASTKSFSTVYALKRDFGMITSLQSLPEGLAFVTEDAVALLPSGSAPTAASAPAWQYGQAAYAAASKALPSRIDSLCFSSLSGVSACLNELWLVDRQYDNPRAAKASGKAGLYLVTGFARTKMDYYAKFMREHSLDMLTIDMKDDEGDLRFTPRSPLLQRMGKVSSPLDLEPFVAKMKAQGVYLVARIVVFKDQRIHEYSGGKYAVWDSRLKKPWQGSFALKPSPAPSPSSAAAPAGIPGATAPAATSPAVAPAVKLSAEYWVDPYCEDVWRYNVAIAKEVIARGFDEVQFDYIRFPTDGDNLDDASYRWRDAGMDKESALMSFLNYARQSISAPISVDIYGANGWYRTGVRTGQDVEMLQRYVDVICPMLYPSHFEQDFLDMPPAEDRPWRIYYFGSLRNTYIARYRAIVRPWVQAFYMNVRYDRAYYNEDYVKREVKGVRDAANRGMTFWNNGGRYADVPNMAGALSISPPAPAKPALPAKPVSATGTTAPAKTARD